METLTSMYNAITANQGRVAVGEWFDAISSFPHPN